MTYSVFFFQDLVNVLNPQKKQSNLKHNVLKGKFRLKFAETGRRMSRQCPKRTGKGIMIS